jgi:hypothetical protein
MSQRRAVLTIGVLVLAAGLMCALGCGKKKAAPPASADECAKAFAQALSEARYEDAAKLYDYVGYAKATNGDWDTLATGARNEIVGKLREAEVGKLKGAFPAGTKVTAQGSGGVYTLSAGGAAAGSIAVQQAGNGWLIAYSE